MRDFMDFTDDATSDVYNNILNNALEKIGAKSPDKGFNPASKDDMNRFRVWHAAMLGALAYAPYRYFKNTQ